MRRPHSSPFGSASRTFEGEHGLDPFTLIRVFRCTDKTCRNECKESCQEEQTTQRGRSDGQQNPDPPEQAVFHVKQPRSLRRTQGHILLQLRAVSWS
jgi:hypothetical protein